MSSYRVFGADFRKHRDVVLALWRRNLADTEKLEEKIEWHFENNPCGEGKCWLLEADGELVGTTSLGLRRLKIGDRVITAGVACDLAVDRKHRFLQPALMLQKALLASIKPPVPMIYGFPGSGGAAVLTRVGYRQLCLIDRYAKALLLSPYLSRDARLAPFARMAGGTLDYAYTVLSSLRERSCGRNIAEVLDDFDERFDELWRRNQNRYALLTVRDSGFMRWRYRDCPLRQYTTLGLLSSDRSRLLGYLIYYVQDSQAICADLFVDGGADKIRCLLSKWFEIARGKSITAVSMRCSADSALLEVFEQLRFSRRTELEPAPATKRNGREQSRALLVYDDETVPGLKSTSQWYFTEGDQPYN